MTDDPVQRSRDFDGLEQQAGGPAAIIAGLVSGVRSLRLITRITVCGLLLDFGLTVAFGLLYLRAETNQNAIRNTARDLVVVNRQACEHSNENGDRMNALISSLIVAVTQTTSLPTEEKARRITTYEAARPVRERC